MDPGSVVSYRANILNHRFQLTLKATSAIRHVKNVLEKTSIKIAQHGKETRVKSHRQ